MTRPRTGSHKSLSGKRDSSKHRLRPALRGRSLSSRALHESFLRASREIRATLIGRFAEATQAVEIVIESTKEGSGTVHRLLPRGNRGGFFVNALPSRRRAWRGARLCAMPSGDAPHPSAPTAR